jgi:signal peptidase
MAPALLSGDVVLDGPPKSTYHPGDIITFRHSDLTTDVVTHRITDLRSTVIHTKGDANRTADVWDIRPNQVQGIVVVKLPLLGYLLVFLRKPVGVTAAVVGVLALMLLWELALPKKKNEAKSESADEQVSSIPSTR